MYNLISVGDDHGTADYFERGIAVEFVGDNELTVYPVNITLEEFNGIVAALGNSIVSE